MTSKKLTTLGSVTDGKRYIINLRACSRGNEDKLHSSSPDFQQLTLMKYSFSSSPKEQLIDNINI